MVTIKQDKKGRNIWLVTVMDSEGFHRQLPITFDDMRELVRQWYKIRYDMNNEYKDPYMPDEEDIVEVGNLRPWGHEVHCKQRVNKKVLKQRAKENAQAEEEWLSYDRKTKQHPNARDNRILCHKTSPWADCIEALEIYESKTP